MGSRTVTAVLEARYWLTPAGLAATEAARSDVCGLCSTSVRNIEGHYQDAHPAVWKRLTAKAGRSSCR